MKDNVKNNLVLNLSDNFKFTSKGEVAGVDTLSESDTYMDSRMALLSYHTDFKGLQWYLNYLETAAYFARRNPTSYPSYMLKLGYVPVVYMPSCVGTLGVKMMADLDKLQIPYVRMRATSFVVPYFQSDMVDAWASKLHLGEYFNVAPESIRSSDVIRRLFTSG